MIGMLESLEMIFKAVMNKRLKWRGIMYVIKTNENYRVSAKKRRYNRWTKIYRTKAYFKKVRELGIDMYSLVYLK